MNGYLERVNMASYLCRFNLTNCWPERYGSMPIICCSFQISQRYDIDDYKKCLVLNSNSRKISICGIEIGKLIKPNFFDLVPSIDVSPFYIQITPEDIEMIESARKSSDVYLTLDLEVLVALNKTNSHVSEEFTKMTLVLNALIPKSNWLDIFLPRWNYFNNREKIIFLDKLDSKMKIKELIASARKNFALNDYQGTISKLFIALETIPKELGYKDVKTMFLKLTTEGAEKDKFQKINDIFKATKDYMNIARHVEKDYDCHENIEISRSDANFAIIYTEVLINYILENLA